MSQTLWIWVFLSFSAVTTKQQCNVSKAMRNMIKAEEEIKIHQKKLKDVIKTREEKEEKLRNHSKSNCKFYNNIIFLII